MKKTVISLVLLLLILAGCQRESPGIHKAMALRDKLLSSGCSFTADITADFGDRIYSFTMDCTVDTLGAMNFTVVQPESIAGITGNITERGGNLTFDDTALSFPLLAEDLLSPISAPWTFVKALRSGRVDAASKWEDGWQITVYDSFEEHALMLDIWLNNQGIPVQTQILSGERKILSMDIKNFSLK